MLPCVLVASSNVASVGHSQKDRKKRGQAHNDGDMVKRRNSRKIPLETRNSLPAEQCPPVTDEQEEDSSGQKFRTPSPYSWQSR